MLKKILLVGAVSTLLIGTAQAADVIEEPMVYDWTGFYVGLQAGYAWGGGEADSEFELPGVFPLDTDGVDPDGFVGGLHAGYLLQSDSLVFGIEGDIEYSDINGSTEVVFDAGPGFEISEIDYDIDWLGSLRLRLGYTWDRVLLYATGGVAVGGVSLDEDVGPLILPGFPTDSDDGTKWGWTLGGGIDYAIWDDVSLRLEYRYTDLGNSKTIIETPGAGPVDFIETKVENDFHAVRAGVSWRFR